MHVPDRGAQNFCSTIAVYMELMFCNDGIIIWLGDLDSGTISPLCGTFFTKDGITGNVTLLKHLSHIRLRYKVKAGKTHQYYRYGLLP